MTPDCPRLPHTRGTSFPLDRLLDMQVIVHSSHSLTLSHCMCAWMLLVALPPHVYVRLDICLSAALPPGLKMKKQFFLTSIMCMTSCVSLYVCVLQILMYLHWCLCLFVKQIVAVDETAGLGNKCGLNENNLNKHHFLNSHLTFMSLGKNYKT